MKRIFPIWRFMMTNDSNLSQSSFQIPVASLSLASVRSRWSCKRLCMCWATFVLAAWFCPAWVAEAAQWKARKQLASRNPAKTLWWLDLAATVAGTNAEERFLRARAHRKLGRLDLNSTYLVEAFELGYPRKPLEHEHWLSLAQSGRLRESEPHLDSLIASPQGDTAEAYEAFVNGFGMSHRYDDALKILDAWIQEFGHDPYPYYLRGRTLRILHKIDRAILDFEHALRLDDKYYAAALELGDIYSERLAINEALHYYQFARGTASEVGRSAQVGQARCYHKLGKSARSRQILRDVLAVDPTHVQALLEISSLDLEEKRPEQAVAQLRQVVVKEPRDIEARNSLARALQATGNIDEARLHFNYVADAQSALNIRREELIRHLRKSHGDKEARHELGTIELTFGSEEKGLELLASVLALDANHRPTIESLMRYHGERSSEDPRHRALADRFRRHLNELPQAASPAAK